MKLSKFLLFIKETKNIDSFSGLKICGNCGFLVKKKDEFFNCRGCDGNLKLFI